MRKPTLAVWKLASCDGCQLSLLELEDQLLELAGRIDFAYFPEATSRVSPPPYDLSLVEGSVTTPDDVDRIRRIRRDSRTLVAIGACATAGGIQALRQFADVEDYARYVYPTPRYLSMLATSTPISRHVAVDFELRGCPVDKMQLLEVVTAFINGRTPSLPSHSVCLDCKLAGNVCVAILGKPCLGPVTQTGCGAVCPRMGRGCYGCFGPASSINSLEMSRELTKSGLSDSESMRLFRTYNAAAPAFLEASKRYES